MKVRNRYSFGKRSKKRAEGVSDYLKLCMNKALKCSPIDIGVPLNGGSRTDEVQNAIFKKGHSRCDGFIKRSFHQMKDVKGKGQALDLVPYIPNKGFCYDAYGRLGIIGMLMLEAWEELQDERLIPKDIHLHWGGLWSHKNPKKLGWDLAHFEIRPYPQIERV